MEAGAGDAMEGHFGGHDVFLNKVYGKIVSEEDMEEFKNNVKEELSNNNYLIMDISSMDDKARIRNDNGELYEMDGMHSVFITGNDEDGIFVSTWGGRYKVLYQDIMDYNFEVDVYRMEDVETIQ